ncbi:MAG: VWA domain-containing protein [Oscillospiraceae bacterium]|nr:VWA domain-containing protein [Oscillospiraceae bacterium]
MKKHSKIIFRISSLLLILLMLVGIFTAVPFTATAATASKTVKSYEIAVVFDNSGSMYTNQAWCRAKYAMEIFASMLNYDNSDKLRVFPMWGVTTDGSQPNGGGSYAAIEINNKNDIDKISDLYTPAPSSTPFEPIKEAYNYLKQSNATDKWLIVLTDGAFDHEERKGPSVSVDLQTKLSSLASEEIKIQYLGIGNAKELKSEESKGFYAKKSSETSLKDDLIGICNSIFQRSILPSNRLNGTTLTLDLSMKNLIVFAQGSNAKITSLTDENGNEIKITLDSGQRKYSEISAGGIYTDAPVDTSLAGQVVTFDACRKGTYTLNYSGADAIQIFYEPDVDIKITLTNSDRQVVDPSSGMISAGDYTLTSAIVDSVTGEDVTDAELMGNDVKLITKIKESDDDEPEEYPNGATISLEPDTAIEIWVEGTYLKDYTISTRDDPGAFPLPIIITNPEADLEVVADVLQSQSWYNTKKNTDWKPIKISVKLDDRPLTEEEMAQTQLSLNFSNEIPYRYEAVPSESAYYVYIGSDEDGNYVEPETGRYTLKAVVTYTDEYGTETAEKDSVSFEVQWYSAIWRWLSWIVIAAAIVFLIAVILTRKAWPRKMKLVLDGDGKKKTLTVRPGKRMTLFPHGALSMSAEKDSTVMKMFGRKAKIKVSGVKAKNAIVDHYKVNNVEYNNDNPYKGFIKNGTTIEVVDNKGVSVVGKIYVNSK